MIGRSTDRETRAIRLAAISVAVIGLMLGNLATPAGATSNPPRHPGTIFDRVNELHTTICAHATGPSTASWEAAQDRLIVGSSLGVATCPANLSSIGFAPVAIWYGGGTLYVPLHLRSTTQTQFVNSSWAINWSSYAHVASLASCRGTLGAGRPYGYLACGVSAVASFELLGFVFDLTTGASYFAPILAYPASYSFAFVDRTTYCDPNCTQSHTSAPSVPPSNGSLRVAFDVPISHANASHRWYLIAYLTAEVEAQTFTVEQNFTGVVPMKSRASAGLDMVSPGEGVTLERVTVR